MKVKVPNKVKIGTQEYKVCFNFNLIGDENEFGRINYRTGVISIDPNTGKELFRVSVHEIIHGIERRFSLHMTDDAIDNMAEGVTEFLVDNWGIELDWSEICEE